VVFRDEIVAPVAIIGSLLVIAGAFLASRRETPATAIAAAVSDVEDDAA
jgi:drug/metabolite transporter (DMT)-like permease